jgi:GNAT superfamily N-acetyltransferase
MDMLRGAVEVRRAGLDDVEDLLLLWAQCRDELVRAGRVYPGSPVENIRVRLRAALENGDYHVLGAWWDGRAAGFALLRTAPVIPLVDGSALHVEHLFVTPELRRHGVARALLTGVTCVAERQGAEQVLSNVPPAAREVHRFFARLGFAPLFVRRAVPTVVLRRRLSGDARRPGVDDLLSRRRSLRARRAARPVAAVEVEETTRASAEEPAASAPERPRRTGTEGGESRTVAAIGAARAALTTPIGAWRDVDLPGVER